MYELFKIYTVAWGQAGLEDITMYEKYSMYIYINLENLFKYTYCSYIKFTSHNKFKNIRKIQLTFYNLL